MTEKLIFDSAVEGLLNSGRPDFTPRCISRLTGAGFDPRAKVKPAYPAEQWASLVKILSEEIYPGLDELEAQRKMALRTVDAFAHSMIGSAMFAVVGLLGPDRTVRRMTRNFRSSSNFLETTCTEISPHSFEIVFNDVTGVPGFYMGLLEGGFLRAGAKNLSVTIKSREAPGAIYLTSWS